VTSVIRTAGVAPRQAARYVIDGFAFMEGCRKVSDRKRHRIGGLISWRGNRRAEKSRALRWLRARCPEARVVPALLRKDYGIDDVNHAVRGGDVGLDDFRAADTGSALPFTVLALVIFTFMSLPFGLLFRAVTILYTYMNMILCVTGHRRCSRQAVFMDL